MITILDLPTASVLTTADYGKAVRHHQGLQPGITCELATDNPGGRFIGVLANLYTVGAQQFAKVSMSGIQQLQAGAAFASGTALAIDTNARFVTRVQGDIFGAYARGASSGSGAAVFAEILGDDSPFDRTDMFIRRTNAALANTDIGRALATNANSNFELATAAGPVQANNTLERLTTINGIQYAIATSCGTTKTGIVRLLCDQIIATGDELAAFVSSFHRTAGGAIYAFVALEPSTAINQLVLARALRGTR